MMVAFVIKKIYFYFYFIDDVSQNKNNRFLYIGIQKFLTMIIMWHKNKTQSQKPTS